MSLAMFGALVGASGATVSKWERGTAPRREREEQLARVVQELRAKEPPEGVTPPRGRRVEEAVVTAEEITEARWRHDLTLTEFGALVGVSAVTVSRWERGHVPRRRRRERLVRVVRELRDREPPGREPASREPAQIPSPDAAGAAERLETRKSSAPSRDILEAAGTIACAWIHARGEELDVPELLAILSSVRSALEGRPAPPAPRAGVPHGADPA